MACKSESLLVKAARSSGGRIKCSLSDHFAFRSPISIVFLYRDKIPSEFILEALKTTLNDFPIFSGVLSKNSGDLYIECNNQGVRVKIVQIGRSLFQSLDLEKLNTTRFIDEIRPYKDLKQGNPLLLIQLSYYQDGMAIGYCWHHSVGDMETFMQFLKALSNSAQKKMGSPPVIPTDRTSYLGTWLKEKKIGICNHKKDSKLKRLTVSDFWWLIKQSFSPKKTLYLYFTEDELLLLRKAISEKAGRKLSRNDVLCAYLVDLLTGCRLEKQGSIYASLVVNMRSRLGIPSNTLGNYIDLVSIGIDEPSALETSASSINLAVRNYLVEHFQYFETEEFVRENGGMKKISRIMPEKMLPPYNNFTITNWSQFGVYSIDFGLCAPYLVLPVGRTPLPWVACIVEGFENKGLLVTLALPLRAANKLSEKKLKKHPSIVSKL